LPPGSRAQEDDLVDVDGVRTALHAFEPAETGRREPVLAHEEDLEGIRLHAGAGGLEVGVGVCSAMRTRSRFMPTSSSSAGPRALGFSPPPLFFLPAGAGDISC